MAKQRTVNVYLVAAGEWHDIDFARLELLKLFAEDERIRAHVAEDYHDLDAINASDFLVTYTCNLAPSEAEQRALRDYVAGGKRWFALHGTNAIINHLGNFRFDCPENYPVLMQTLGTQFIAHPPIEPFKVTVADPDHELVKGVGEFETNDELYLCRVHGKLHTLLETRYAGKFGSDDSGFVVNDWPDDEPRPVYYINRVGAGEVLYLNLGHCRGHYDMRSLGIDYYPAIERCAWELPQYYELLRRGIRYCASRVS
jgi:type 1 glutamine amidotransferase